jgi:hypothetical protein
MLFHALSDEFCARSENEVTAHSLPNKMEVIVIEPHIGARSLDCVFLPFEVISQAAGPGHFAYVLIALKQARRARLGRRKDYHRCRKDNRGQGFREHYDWRIHGNHSTESLIWRLARRETKKTQLAKNFRDLILSFVTAHFSQFCINNTPLP